MKVFIQSIVCQVLLNFYILQRGCQALPPKRKWRVPFILLFIAEVSLYFFGLAFLKDLPDNILNPVMAICNTWYVATIYISLGLFVLDFIRLTNRIRPWYPKAVRNHWQGVKTALFLLFIPGITGVMIQGYHNVVHTDVRHVYLHIPKAAAGRDSLTLVMMSDMHFGRVIKKPDAQRFVSLCNAQHPDMVILAGDVIDHESYLVEQAHIEDDLQQLKAPLGVYITLGNHEYRANRFAKLRWLPKTGGICLIDSVVMPDSAFYLIGRDDYMNRKRASLQSLMKGVDTAKPIIVIDHQPVSINEITMNKADLGLHGHTHNGQLWPYPLVLRILFECSYGYYRKGGSQFYVSSGIGVAGPPFRIGTRSELVVLHITFDKAE
jgi:predicted MPP superfamily phosphohydrolase